MTYEIPEELMNKLIAVLEACQFYGGDEDEYNDDEVMGVLGSLQAIRNPPDEDCPSVEPYIQ